MRSIAFSFRTNQTAQQSIIPEEPWYYIQELYERFPGYYDQPMVIPNVNPGPTQNWVAVDGHLGNINLPLDRDKIQPFGVQQPNTVPFQYGGGDGDDGVDQAERSSVGSCSRNCAGGFM